MLNKKSLLLASLLALSTTSAFAAPHFYMQMENRSDKDATISFQQDGTIFSLDPVLADNTPLAAHGASTKYGVTLSQMDPKATFNIVFKGTKECVFTVGTYSPGDPKVAMAGPGCLGGGYELVNHMLIFYISDITHAQKSK